MKKESYFYCAMIGLGFGKFGYIHGLAFADKKTKVEDVFDSIKEDVAKCQDCSQDKVIMLAFNRV